MNGQTSAPALGLSAQEDSASHQWAQCCAWGVAVANHALNLSRFRVHRRPDRAYDHVAACICDAILQAGLNYNAVVAPRISVLQQCTSDLVTILDFKEIGESELRRILRWRGIEKPARIVRVLRFLEVAGVNTVEDLERFLSCGLRSASLLGIHGVGRKTVDYLRLLVGGGGVAIDRHIRRFSLEAGADCSNDQELSVVIEIAAGALKIRSQDLDWSIWNYMSRRRSQTIQAD